MIQLIHDALLPVANAASLPIDNFKILVCVGLSYPLSGLLKRLPDSHPAIKNIYTISISLFFLLGVFDLWTGLRTLLISSLGTYALAASIKSHWMPWLVFVFVMGHMGINHIYRQRFGSRDIVDITGAQMVLVMKLTAFGWNIQDGRIPQDSLETFQKRSALKKMPSLLDYLGYVFFFPALLTGPSFDFAEYGRWLDCSLFDVQVPPSSPAYKKWRKRRRIPRSARPALRRAFEAVLYLALFAFLSGRYDVSQVIDPAFEQVSILGRLAFLLPLALTHRMKYYGIWKLAEGACILAGLGFNGLDTQGHIRWNAIENISPREFELARNTKAVLEAWNKNTNRWLKNYVYLRVTPKGQKPGFTSTLATFSTSAFWHGFYPGYYFAFPTGALVQNVGKQWRRYIRPWFLTPDLSRPTAYKKYYDIVCWIVTQVTWSYIVQPFIVLGFWDSLIFWKRYGFFVHVGLVLNWLFFASPLGALLKRKVKERSIKHAYKSDKKIVSDETPIVNEKHAEQHQVSQ